MSQENQMNIVIKEFIKFKKRQAIEDKDA